MLENWKASVRPWQVCEIFDVDDVGDTVFVWEKLYKEVIEEHVK